MMLLRQCQKNPCLCPCLGKSLEVCLQLASAKIIIKNKTISLIPQTMPRQKGSASAPGQQAEKKIIQVKEKRHGDRTPTAMGRQDVTLETQRDRKQKCDFQFAKTPSLTQSSWRQTLKWKCVHKDRCCSV